jgi:hypothetical protein
LIHPEYRGFPKGNHWINGGGKVKQADVVMLYYPLGLRDDPKMAADLEFYADKYSPAGPAMTDAVNAILHLALNQTDMARASMDLVEMHSHQPFFVWTEDKRAIQKTSLIDMGCYNFLTGAGGYVQALTSGYGGLRITPDGLRVKGTLPAGASVMALKGLQHAGTIFDVEWSREGGEAEANACVHKGALRTAGGRQIAAGSCYKFIGEEVFQAKDLGQSILI